MRNLASDVEDLATLARNLAVTLSDIMADEGGEPRDDYFSRALWARAHKYLVQAAEMDLIDDWRAAHEDKAFERKQARSE